MNVLLLALLMGAAPSPARLRLVDAPLALASGGGWLALDRAAPGLTRTGCPCRADDVPSFDRPAINARWSHGSQAANLSLGVDLLLAGLALHAGGDGLESTANDLGLVGEAMALTGLATEAAKIGFARPYPYLLRPSADAFQQRSGINYASFWSGHSAVTMALAVSTAALLERHGAPWKLRVAAWILGPLLAIAAGSFQVLQANHYPSDVAVGAVAGASLGWLVVALH